MTLETLDKVHQIVNKLRLTGPQYSFLIRQAHPERGGAAFTHSFNRHYLGEKYEKVKQEVQNAGLSFTLFAKDRSNESLQIQHELAMPPAKVRALLENHGKLNNNSAGLRAIMKQM